MSEEKFVVGQRDYEIRSVYSLDRSTAQVVITLDGRFEWTATVSGWRLIALGSSGAQGYIWAARQLLLLPKGPEHSLDIVEFDEDLLTVFSVADSWLTVCETSVRLLSGTVETDRVELREAIEVARWKGDALHVRDTAGAQLTVRVDGRKLAT